MQYSPLSYYSLGRVYPRDRARQPFPVPKKKRFRQGSQALYPGVIVVLSAVANASLSAAVNGSLSAAGNESLSAAWSGN